MWGQISYYILIILQRHLHFRSISEAFTWSELSPVTIVCSLKPEPNWHHKTKRISKHNAYYQTVLREINTNRGGRKLGSHGSSKPPLSLQTRYGLCHHLGLNLSEQTIAVPSLHVVSWREIITFGKPITSIHNFPTSVSTCTSTIHLWPFTHPPLEGHVQGQLEWTYQSENVVIRISNSLTVAINIHFRRPSITHMPRAEVCKFGARSRAVQQLTSTFWGIPSWERTIGISPVESREPIHSSRRWYFSHRLPSVLC